MMSTTVSLSGASPMILKRPSASELPVDESGRRLGLRTSIRCLPVAAPWRRPREAPVHALLELEIRHGDRLPPAAFDFAREAAVDGLPRVVASGCGNSAGNLRRTTVPRPVGTTSRKRPSSQVSLENSNNRGVACSASAWELNSTRAFATPWPLVPSRTRPVTTNPRGNLSVCSISRSVSGISIES